MADPSNPDPRSNVIGVTPGAKAPAEPVEKSQDAVDWELYGADAPKAKGFAAPEVMLREPLRQRQDEIANVLGLDTNARQAANREFVATVRETGLEANIAGVIYNALTDAQLAEARGEPVNEARTREWQQETRAQLAATYGRERAEELMRQTAQYVEANPKLKTMLSTRGIGMNPRVALELVEHVRRSRR